jgi:antitoxin component HigA of HigAB toxin-antitoxin module
MRVIGKLSLERFWKREGRINMVSATAQYAKNGLSASDLGRLLGHRELGSKILKRQRQLTVGHIKKLSAYFRVSPATFV